MRKWLRLGLAIVGLAFAAVFIVNIPHVYAQQALKEPSLDGIPNSDFAQWSYTYGGGGIYGGACPPMPPAGMYAAPPAYMGPPPVKKKKVRSRRR